MGASWYACCASVSDQLGVHRLEVTREVLLEVLLEASLGPLMVLRPGAQVAILLDGSGESEVMVQVRLT